MKDRQSIIQSFNCAIEGFIYVMKVGTSGDLFAEVVPIITDDVSTAKKKAWEKPESSAKKLWDDGVEKVKGWYKEFVPKP